VAWLYGTYDQLETQTVGYAANFSPHDSNANDNFYIVLHEKVNMIKV